LLKILQKLGACADCSSNAEIYLAKKAGINDLIYSGIYYSKEDLEYGVKNDIKINLDNTDKLNYLASLGVKEVCFRLNPGIGNGKYNQIVTAGKEAKFGIIEEDLLNAYREAKKLGFNKFGIHMMGCVNLINGRR
jgi:diaminopimelate decarboxylase